MHTHALPLPPLTSSHKSLPSLSPPLPLPGPPRTPLRKRNKSTVHVGRRLSLGKPEPTRSETTFQTSQLTLMYTIMKEKWERQRKPNSAPVEFLIPDALAGVPFPSPQLARSRWAQSQAPAAPRPGPACRPPARPGGELRAPLTARSAPSRAHPRRPPKVCRPGSGEREGGERSYLPSVRSAEGSLFPPAVHLPHSHPPSLHPTPGLGAELSAGGCGNQLQQVQSHGIPNPVQPESASEPV